MGSNWNSWMETILAANLTVAEHRLALALARELLGYRQTAKKLGERRLRRLTRLDGRTFERARRGLIEKSLIHFTAGTVGRAGAGTYELAFAMSGTPVPERAIKKEEIPGRRRVNRQRVIARSQSTEMPALPRVRIGSKGKTSRPSDAGRTFQARVVEAYCGAGGSLELVEWRGALARIATTLVNTGTDETLILTAASALGRERAFPGYLRQRVEQLRDEGPPCAWAGLNRSKLNPAQLAECGCEKCGQWAQAKGPSPDALVQSREISV